MSLKIEIYVPEDVVTAGQAGRYLARSLSAIGYSPDAGAVTLSGETEVATAPDFSDKTARAIDRAEDETPPDGPIRERGKPSPGKARRTKEEIAEDEAADRADAAGEAGGDAVKPNISTGDERIDPANADDAAKDAADETAEQAAGPTLTHDNVRAALKKYLDAYGTAAAMEDGPKVLTMLFGEGKVKVSDVPEDQTSLQQAINGVEEMLAKNPYKRDPQL